MHFNLIVPSRKKTEILPGSAVLSGSELVNQRFQSRVYCSKDAMMPWKLGSLSNSVTLSQQESVNQLVQGLSICSALSSTYKHTHQLNIVHVTLATQSPASNFYRPILEPVLFCFHYICSHLAPSYRHNISFHCYAENTQLYLPITLTGSTNLFSPSNCITDIKNWMSSN